MEELASRVSNLEEKLASKDDELLVLRSAIANLTRRLNACEEHTKVCSCGQSTAGGNGGIGGDAAMTTVTGPRHEHAAAGKTKTVTIATGMKSGTSRSPHSTGARAPSPGVSRRQLPIPGQSSGRQQPPVPRQTVTSLARATSSPSMSRRQVSGPSMTSKPPLPTSPSRDAAHGTPAGSVPSTTITDVPSSPSMNRHSHMRKSGSRKRGGSAGSSHSSAGGTTSGNTSSTSGSLATTTNLSDSTVRMYLRGKPCSFYAPSDYPLAAVEHPQKAPTERLELEWVYGYRGRDCRSNLFVLASGEVLYFLAAIGIVLNRLTRTQRHYRQHTDDIKVMAMHPNGVLAATGQVTSHDKEKGKAHIRVWNTESLETMAVISDPGFERGFCCVGFSQQKSGSLLFAIDEGNSHQLSVWDWSKSQKLAESRSHGDAILCASFTPADDRTIVMAGKQHVTFWTLDGCKLTKKAGLFEKHPKPRFITCLTFNGNHDLVTGDSTGSILVWSAGGNRITQIIKNAHEGSILCLLILEDGTLLSGGGKDRRIVAWDTSYEPTGEEYELPDTQGSVRMLAEITEDEADGATMSTGDGPVVLVGTTFNSILEGSLTTGFREIIKGHSEELWGLAVHPMQDRFVTAGFDKIVNCWDASSHDVVWSAPLADEASSVAIHPTGDIVVVGLKTGRWIVFDGSSGTYITSGVEASDALACVKFSPDGRMLAIGSRDSFIYIYSVTDDMKSVSRFGKCSGHSSAVTHLDWSTDSQYMQTLSADYDLLFWKAKTCKQMTSPVAMRDVIWASYSCPLGFPVVGIWPEGADGTDINTVHRNSTSSLLATGDDFNKVKLFRFPLPQPRSQCHQAVGHSSHVTNVQFMQDDSLLISTGGKDTCVLQWQVLIPDDLI